MQFFIQIFSAIKFKLLMKPIAIFLVINLMANLTFDD